MRIIGGKSGGRILKVPKGLGVRPTPDLVKQAIFNSLGARIQGAEVLELFGGSGALSLESLSRGAMKAVIIEKSPKHARMIRSNFETLEFDPEGLEIRIQDFRELANSWLADESSTLSSPIHLMVRKTWVKGLNLLPRCFSTTQHCLSCSTKMKAFLSWGTPSGIRLKSWLGGGKRKC
jgi:hypothetical protein